MSFGLDNKLYQICIKFNMHEKDMPSNKGFRQNINITEKLL